MCALRPARLALHWAQDYDWRVLLSLVQDRMVSSRYFIGGAPTCCAHCKQPFPVVSGRIEAWRSSLGGYFCNEFCAGDDEEAAFQT